MILENVIFASQITCKKRQNFAKNSSRSCASLAVQPALKPKYEKSFTPNPLFGSKIREHIYVWNGWLDLGKKFKTSARNQSDARNRWSAKLSTTKESFERYALCHKQYAGYIKNKSQRFARFRASVLLISASNFLNCCKHLTIGVVYTSMLIFEKIILTRMPKNNKITCVRGFPLQISGTRIVPYNSQISVEKASLHVCLSIHTSRWLK